MCPQRRKLLAFPSRENKQVCQAASKTGMAQGLVLATSRDGYCGRREGFVDLAHEEMAKIQAYAFRTRRSTALRGPGRYERAAAALLAKATQGGARARSPREPGSMNEDDKGRVLQCGAPGPGRGRLRGAAPIPAAPELGREETLHPANPLSILQSQEGPNFSRRTLLYGTTPSTPSSRSSIRAGECRSCNKPGSGLRRRARRRGGQEHRRGMSRGRTR